MRTKRVRTAETDRRSAAIAELWSRPFPRERGSGTQNRDLRQLCGLDNRLVQMRTASRIIACGGPQRSIARKKALWRRAFLNELAR